MSKIDTWVQKLETATTQDPTTVQDPFWAEVARVMQGNPATKAIVADVRKAA